MKKLVVISAALGLVLVCLPRLDLAAQEPVKNEPPAAAPAAADAAAEPAIPKESLRYDGKSFDQWRDELHTELKAERRTEAIQAFAAFGARGYGAEATVAILEVMRKIPLYPMGDPETKLNEAALDAFGPPAPFYDDKPQRIDPTAAAPILLKELKEGNRNGRLFAAAALGRIGPPAQAAIPLLLDVFASDKDPDLRPTALQSVVTIDQSGKTIVSLLEQAIKDNDAQEFGSRLQGIGWSPWLTEFDLDAAPIRFPGGGYMQPQRLAPQGQTVLKLLIETLSHKNQAIRQEAIRGLGGLGTSARGAVLALIQAFKGGDPDDRVVIAQALETVGPAAKEAVPVLSEVLLNLSRIPDANRKDGDRKLAEAITAAIRKINAPQDARGR